jgi:MFS family permease
VDVSTVEYSGSGRDTIAPRGGVRTYAVLLWPLQFLAGLIMGIVTLAMAIPVNAYGSFWAGSALALAVGYGATFVFFTPAAALGGLLVDRWGPKKTLLASNVGYLTLMVVSLVSLAAGYLPEWLVWVALLGRVASQSVQITALESAVPVLFPKRYIGRANGSRMFLTTAVAAFEAPLAAALFPVIGLKIVLLVTCAVVIAAIAAVVRAEIPFARQPETAAAGSVTSGRGYKPLRAYVRSRRGLVALLGIFAFFNFVVGFAEVADGAITQGFGSAATLDIVLGIGLISMLVSTVGITIWGLPRRPVRWLLIFSLVFAAALVLGASRPNLLPTIPAAVLFLGSAPFIMGIIGTLLQTKTEPGLMGRMMGLKTMIVGITYGAGNVVGALCSAVPRPLIGGKRLRTGFLASLVGTGQADGRGYAFMTMVLGVLAIVIFLLASRLPSLRYLDSNLPDVTAEDLAQRHAPLEPRPSGTEQRPAHRPANAAPMPALEEP